MPSAAAPIKRWASDCLAESKLAEVIRLLNDPELAGLSAKRKESQKQLL